MRGCCMELRSSRSTAKGSQRYGQSWHDALATALRTVLQALSGKENIRIDFVDVDRRR